MKERSLNHLTTNTAPSFLIALWLVSLVSLQWFVRWPNNIGFSAKMVSKASKKLLGIKRTSLTKNIQMQWSNICKSSHDTFHKPTAHCQTLLQITLLAVYQILSPSHCSFSLQPPWSSVMLTGVIVRWSFAAQLSYVGESERSGWERPEAEVGHVHFVQF